MIHGQPARRTDSQAATELFYARPPISHRDCRDLDPDTENIDVYRRQGKYYQRRGQQCGAGWPVLDFTSSRERPVLVQPTAPRSMGPTRPAGAPHAGPARRAGQASVSPQSQ